MLCPYCILPLLFFFKLTRFPLLCRFFWTVDHELQAVVTGQLLLVDHLSSSFILQLLHRMCISGHSTAVAKCGSDQLLRLLTKELASCTDETGYFQYRKEAFLVMDYLMLTNTFAEKARKYQGAGTIHNMLKTVSSRVSDRLLGRVLQQWKVMERRGVTGTGGVGGAAVAEGKVSSSD